MNTAHQPPFLCCCSPFCLGTLHYHFIVFGGITPYVLQRFSRVEEVCHHLADVLDSMYQSSLPNEVAIQTIIQKILQDKGSMISFHAKEHMDKGTRNAIMSKREFLFERSDFLGVADLSSCDVPFRVDLKNIQEHTDAQAGQQQFHSPHRKTCRAGLLGKTGCRLCMPQDVVSKTKPVELFSSLSDDDFDEEKEEEQEDYYDDINDEPDNERQVVEDEDSGNGTGKESTGNTMLDHETNDSSETEDDDLEERILYIVSDPPQHSGESRWLKYNLQHAYERKYDDSAIVWETKRPKPNPQLAVLQKTELDGKVSVLNRNDIIESLKEALEMTENYSLNSPFWNWLEGLSDYHLVVFYGKLIKGLEEANGYIATFNPILSYCTGAHNNCQMLGGMVQAKGAIFYIAPVSKPHRSSDATIQRR